VIVAERLLQAFADIEHCGHACKITSCLFTMTGDEGATSTLAFMSEADLLRTDAQDAAARRAKMHVVK
jgi:hypothetical protein